MKRSIYTLTFTFVSILIAFACSGGGGSNANAVVNSAGTYWSETILSPETFTVPNNGVYILKDIVISSAMTGTSSCSIKLGDTTIFVFAEGNNQLTLNSGIVLVAGNIYSNICGTFDIPFTFAGIKQ